MLVLSRMRDETIMIGDDIEVTVVDIRGDKVRLGTIAPREIPVHRREVYDAIKRDRGSVGTQRTPAAWRFELARSKDGDEYCNWGPVEVSLSPPCVPKGSIRNLVPLYV